MSKQAKIVFVQGYSAIAARKCECGDGCMMCSDEYFTPIEMAEQGLLDIARMVMALRKKDERALWSARRRHDCGRHYIPSNATYCWFCHCG